MKIMIPEGYLTIKQAVKQCEGTASWQRAFAPAEGSPFLARNVDKPAMIVLETALVSGELLAAVIRASDGELIAMPAASWRRRYSRPVGDQWDLPSGIQMYVPAAPFAEAVAGRDIPATTTPAGKPDCWGKPIIAEYDLSRWWGDTDPLPLPFLRPAKWPASVASSASMEVAITWMREHGRGIRKVDEPGCMMALGCSREVARKAATEVFGSARMGRPRK